MQSKITTNGKITQEKNSIRINQKFTHIIMSDNTINNWMENSTDMKLRNLYIHMEWIITKYSRYEITKNHILSDRIIIL